MSNYVTCSIYWFLDHLAIRLLCKGGIGWHARAIHWKFPCWSTTQWQTKVTCCSLFPFPWEKLSHVWYTTLRASWHFQTGTVDNICQSLLALLSSNLCQKLWCFNLLKVHGVVDQTTCLFHNEPNGSEKRITTVWLVYMYGETKYWMLCSTKGVGRTAPDTKEYMALPDGVTVPLGKPVETGIEHVRVSCPTCILEWCLDLSVPKHHARLTIKEESTWSQFLFLHRSHILSCCIEKPVHYHLFMVIWGKCRQAFSTMSTLCTTPPRSVCGMSWRSILTTSADAADVSEVSRFLPVCAVVWTFCILRSSPPKSTWRRIPVSLEKLFIKHNTDKTLGQVSKTAIANFLLLEQEKSDMQQNLAGQIMVEFMFSCINH